MEVAGSCPSIGGAGDQEFRSSWREKRPRELEVFQEAVAAGVNEVKRLVALSGGDSRRIVRNLAKWGEASPDMFAALISMGPEEGQKGVARDVMSCLGQRGGLPMVESLYRALPQHIRPDLEEVRQHLLDIEQLRHQLGGLQV
jgi:hypothetical protein